MNTISTLPISAIIIVKNEEQNLPTCLSSLNFVSEIVVIDSGSTDKTVEIALQAGCKVFQTDWKGYAATKQYGIDRAVYDWILWIDADEMVSAELQNEIIQFMQNAKPEQAGSFPRKTFFLNQWIRHCGWYPGYVTRLFHRKTAKMNQNILHEGVELLPTVQTIYFQHDLLHYSYQSLHQYFQKMNDYGLDGARELQRRGKKFHPLQLISNTFWNFFRFYVLKRGFLDGIPGLLISIGSGFSNFIKYSNLYYLERETNNQSNKNK
ncbi:MAG: glycosyltransferase family 2 protein [Bacteroidia bacterium]|nr:glycosyltransferase family 2 protein [Bacteroidia bacterium]